MINGKTGFPGSGSSDWCPLGGVQVFPCTADIAMMGSHAPAMLDDNHLMRKTLKLVKLFEGFSEEDARDFLLWAKRRDVRPGERVIAQGEPGHDMYIVASGSLKVVKSSGLVEEELALLGPGDSFGEIALVDNGERSASVIAMTPSMLLRFERRYLVKIPQVSLKLYRNVATMMAARLRDTLIRVVLGKVAGSLEPEDADGSAAQRVRSRIKLCR